ncbi:MAG: glycogen synthase GlgA [Collinsella phocaeensis]
MPDTTPHRLGVVFASAEAAPFVKTGGLGDVAGSLPSALNAAGADVIVMVPKYATIADEYKAQMEHVGEFYVPLGWRNEYCGLERLVHDGVTYIFIDNERYFGRSYPYGFFDDGERFAYFSKAVCESLQYLPDGFTCDILHCNDWHTALAPVFLREFYQGLPVYENVKCVFSIHNIAFQGQFTDMLLGDVLGLSHIEPAVRQLRCDDRSINYMLGAINYSDAIGTVSPTYAAEICTPEYGEGLDGALRRRRDILHGILNGIDVVRNDPASDPRIEATYTVADRSGKAACKAALQRELGLEVRDDRPLMVMVTRLTRQKGMDLVTYALDRILSGGVQVAILGTGDYDYEEALRYFERTYPAQMAARIQFDPALSQRMYAAADMFLMPSLFEPCGLSQIIAMRYGTLPIVRETGGLRDTVTPYNQYTGEGTGFSFTHFNGDEMGDAVFRAARLFWDDRAAWDALVTQAMEADFSWTRSAGDYMNLYLDLRPDMRPGVEALLTEQAAAAEAAAKPAKKPARPRKTATKTAAKTPARTKAQKSTEEAGEKAPAPKRTRTRKVAAPAAAEPAGVEDAAEPKKPTARKTARATKPAEEADTAPAKKAPARKTPSKRAPKATEDGTAAPAAQGAEAEPVKKAPAKRPAAKKAATARTTEAKTAAGATDAADKPVAEAEAVKPAAKAAAKPAAKPRRAAATAKKAADSATASAPEPPAAQKAPAAPKAAAKTAAAPAAAKVSDAAPEAPSATIDKRVPHVRRGASRKTK